MSRAFVRASDTSAVSGSLAHGIGTGDFTISAWVYLTATHTYSGLWANGTYAPVFYAANISNRPEVYGLSAGSAFATTLSLNTWYHLAFRRSGTELSCWVDGAKDATTFNEGSPSNVANAVQRWGQSYAGSAESMTGRIAEGTLWAAALSDVELGALGRGVHSTWFRRAAMRGYWPLHGVASPEPDYSGNGAHLTLNNSPAQAAHCRMALPQWSAGWDGAFTASGSPATVYNHRTLLGVGT